MSTDQPTLSGLYAIVDDDAWRRVGVDLSRSGEVEAIVEAIVEAKPAALQLRAKHLDARATLALLRRIGPIARAAGVACFANDRADLAVLARPSGVVGVHVGQDDLAAEDVRRFAPELRVGVSTHGRTQLVDASRSARALVDYVAIGPIFSTMNKENPDATIGLERLAELVRAREVEAPLVAIGGVSRATVAGVRATGVRCAAVIGELVVIDAAGRPALAEIASRARTLDRALRAETA